MRLGNINISREGIFHVNKLAQTAAKKQKRAITERITKQTLTRIRASIIRWQNARNTAESEINPNNTELIRVFKDVEIDAHLFALMQTIKLKVLANKFAVYNENDEIDDEATEIFQKKWFRNVARETVDANFYGFSLVQLGDIVGGCFKNSELIPREYVIQQKRGVKTSLSNTSDLISFDDPKFSNWLIPIGEERNLGLLDKATPLVIKKKEIISAWSEAAEIFGMPIRVGKTAINNPVNRENMEDMLENMGEAAWGVFDSDDEIELISTSKTDFSAMYDKFIDRMNSELSKLILLQTGSTDEKAFVGAAEVHETTLKDVIEAYILEVEDVANEKLIPICQRHGLVKMGVYLKADNEQKFTPKELFDLVKELLVHFDIPEDWITETFEIPVEKKPTPEPLDPTKKGQDPKDEEKKPTDIKNSLLSPDAKPSDIMKAVSALYAKKHGKNAE